jgi:hypothetical protein
MSKKIIVNLPERTCEIIASFDYLGESQSARIRSIVLSWLLNYNVPLNKGFEISPCESHAEKKIAFHSNQKLSDEESSPHTQEQKQEDDSEFDKEFIKGEKLNVIEEKKRFGLFSKKK